MNHVRNGTDERDQVESSKPDIPHGWTPAAWAALRRSPAARRANAIRDRAVELENLINDYLADHPGGDLEVLRAAGVAIPPAVAQRGGYYLDHVRRHFQGIGYVLGEFTSAVGDVIPEPPAGPAIPNPEGVTA